MSVFHWVSTCGFVFFLCGFGFRKQRRIHIPLMITAFLIDLALVLYIELRKDVVHQVSHEMAGMSGILIFHILISVITLILYGLQIYLGITLQRGEKNARYWHKHTGWGLLISRTLNYTSSFLI